ncbi:MAG: ATPase, T2SS/T4P/T4SS family [Candidatus Omnitrophica bacterium]|nr:ATPase, T2SS/T4P/T4SS family [Candidatus Omnitrophota bacterium]
MAGETRKKLGEMLVEDGLIEESQLEEALSIQQTGNERKFIGEILLDLGYLSEEGLSLTLSKKLGMKYVSFSDKSMIINYEQGLEKLVSQQFATDNMAVPLSKTDRYLSIAMWDPLDFMVVDNLKQLTKMDLVIHCSTKTDILDGIDRLYVKKGKVEEEEAVSVNTSKEEKDFFSTADDLDTLKSKAAEAPVVKLVNQMIDEAVTKGASDMHIDPREDRLSIRFRIDGKLYEMETPPQEMQAAIISRIKILSRLDIAEKRLPQDGGFNLKVNGRAIDFRVATLPTIYGEKIVIRLLDKESIKMDLDTIGLSKENYERILANIDKPNGLVFVTGPTGSGKSTMLYCILNKIRSGSKNMMTIEDPVEYRMDTVNQVHAKANIGLDFARVLRAFLRLDPDIIMVGEVRDLETAEICVRCALVGRLVFSTLHTNDCVGTISRLLDFGIEPFLLSTTLNLVIAQRLARKLCTKCKTVIHLEKETIDKYGLEGVQVYGPVGCDVCDNRGYKGRMAIFEVMSVDEHLKSMIEKKTDMVDIRDFLLSKGLKTLRDDGLEKVKQGLTSLDEILAITMGTS